MLDYMYEPVAAFQPLTVSGAPATIGSVTPGYAGTLCAMIFDVTTTIVKGSSTAGTLAVYLGSTELATHNLNDEAQFARITFTFDDVDFTSTDVFHIKVKTQAAGGTPAGAVAGYAVVRPDKGDDTIMTWMGRAVDTDPV